MHGLRVTGVHGGVICVVCRCSRAGYKLSQRKCALTLRAHLTLLVSHGLELLLGQLCLLYATVARIRGGRGRALRFLQLFTLAVIHATFTILPFWRRLLLLLLLLNILQVESLASEINRFHLVRVLRTHVHLIHNLCNFMIFSCCFEQFDFLDLGCLVRCTVHFLIVALIHCHCAFNRGPFVFHFEIISVHKIDIVIRII